MPMAIRWMIVAICVATAGCVTVVSSNLTSSAPGDPRLGPPTPTFPLRNCAGGCSIDVQVTIGSPQNSLSVAPGDVFISVPRGRRPDVTWQLKVPAPHEGSFSFDEAKGIDFGDNAAQFPCSVKTKKVWKCSVNVSGEAPPASYKYTVRVVATSPQSDPLPLDPFVVIE